MPQPVSRDPKSPRTLRGAVRAAAIGLSAALLLAGVPRAGASQTVARTPIIVVSQALQDTLPFHYALQQGLFEKAGLDVTVQMVSQSTAAVEAVLGGSAQVGFTNVIYLGTAHLKGVDLELIAPGGEYNSTAPYTKLLVRADSPIRTAKDLEGHSVAVVGLHDLLQICTVAWLERNGADSTKVKFIEMPPAMFLASLQAQRVDAFHIFEPFKTEAEASGARDLAAPCDAIAPRFMTGGWFAQKSWVAQHRDAALKFSQIVMQAAAYTNAHYKEMAPFIASFTKMPAEKVVNMVQVRVATTLSPTLVQPLLDAAARLHVLSSTFPAQELLLSGTP